MKALLTLLFSFLTLFAEFNVQGHVDVQMQEYLNSAPLKHKNSFTAKQTLELGYEQESLSAFAKLYAQEDYHDTLNEDEHTKRTFARIDELYMKYDFEDDSIRAGKSIKFWGSLEVRNIVNTFNPSDFRSDMFDADYLGVYNASYSHYTQMGELSLTVKVNEQDQMMAAIPYAYYFLPPFLKYDEKLKTSDDVNRPSYFISYNASLDSEYALDYAFIFENGYDSQRYFTASPATAPTKLYQNAYLVNKFMTYDTLVTGTTLLKLEALYADVIDDENIADYSHIALGVEHTIENIYKSASLGLIAEYYRYDTYEDNKYDDLDLYESMQNDLFIGARYTFNNADDTSIVGGVVLDDEYSEENYFLKYSSRFADTFTAECDFQYIEPSTTASTAYAALGRHQRLSINIAYYF